MLPHTSDPPVPVSVVVSGSDPPVPEFRLLLELPDLSSDSASAAEDFFPEPGSLSAWPGFVETFRPRLGGSPPAPGGSERAPLEPGGFMRSREKLCTRYGIHSQGSGSMLFWFVTFGMDSGVPWRNSGTSALWILRARVCTKSF